MPLLRLPRERSAEGWSGERLKRQPDRTPLCAARRTAPLSCLCLQFDPLSVSFVSMQRIHPSFSPQPWEKSLSKRQTEPSGQRTSLTPQKRQRSINGPPAPKPGIPIRSFRIRRKGSPACGSEPSLPSLPWTRSSAGPSHRNRLVLICRKTAGTERAETSVAQPFFSKGSRRPQTERSG